MKILVIILVTYFLSGCTTVRPHISEYRINPNLQTKDLKNGTCSSQSLKIAQAFSSSALMSKNMNYLLGEFKQESYTQSQWSESPNRAITSELVKMLQNSQLFKNVQIYKSRTKSHLLLETNIEDFMQYYSADEKRSYVNVQVNLTLIDTQTNKVVTSKSFSNKLKVDTLSADGGVKALNSALQNVLLEQREWLSEVCK